jgi:outer membrane lipoprotein SlyB
MQRFRSRHFIDMEPAMKKLIGTVSGIILVVLFTGCSEPLTTREKGAAVGTVSGAGLGAIIGSATGNAGAGAGIGAAVGLLGGALIGDQMQARQKQDAEVQRRIEAQQAEIERQRRELEQLKAQQER